MGAQVVSIKPPSLFMSLFWTLNFPLNFQDLNEISNLIIFFAKPLIKYDARKKI
jgi:hypothetical protein